jgi:hypothetical protein
LSQCKTELGLKTISEGLSTLSFEERERVGHFLDHLARAGHEWFQPINILNLLHKQECEIKNLTNLLVQTLPILKLSRSGVIVLIDAEEFFASGDQLCSLMELFNSESKEKEDRDTEVENLKKARGKAGGKTPLKKSRPDVIEGIKDWTSNTGGTAHERRRDEVGQLGFTMQDLYKFV